MFEGRKHDKGLFRYLAGLLAAIGLFVSCSTMHYVRVNHDQTERIADSLYRKNKNAFYITSSYATISTVWTYEKDVILVYRLAKGRIKGKQSFQRMAPVPFSEVSFEDLKTELYQNCPMELDGDVFGIVFETDLGKTRFDFPTDINGMKRVDFGSALLQMLVDDIVSCDLWDVE